MIDPGGVAQLELPGPAIEGEARRPAQSYWNESWERLRANRIGVFCGILILVLALIAIAAPKARVLVLLRDPVDRFRSGLTHTDDASRAALSQGDTAGAFQRGLYGQQLQRVIDAFPREQILIQQYEACRADTAGELARTFAFIGLPPATIDPGRFSRPVNPTTARKIDLTQNLRKALLDGYAPDLERLRSLAPELDLSLWPTARESLGT